jgi:thiazole synthase
LYAEDALRTCWLARELLDGHSLVKLEVLGDPKTLYPDMQATFAAAEQLVKEKFQVMVYCMDDPIACKRLEETGCVAVMPLAAVLDAKPRTDRPNMPMLMIASKSCRG